MTLNFEEYKTKLYSAVLADTLDSLGYHKQTLTPGIKSIKPDELYVGLRELVCICLFIMMMKIQMFTNMK